MKLPILKTLNAKVAGITEVVHKGLNGWLSLDPFHDIDPLSFTPNAEDNT